jgi:putative colanic acid biosynthesis glycosyltransferase
MNKGTARATGRYVVYLNAGDAFTDPECLTMIRQTLENAGHPDLCYAGANYRFAAGHLRYRPPRPVDPAIWHGLPGVHQATFYRREFLEVPPYDLRYTVSSDYYVSARCYLRGGRACYLDRAITEFMVGGISTKHANRSWLEMWRVQRDVLKMGLISRFLSGVRRFVAQRVYVWLNHPNRGQDSMIAALFRLQR